jgi:lysosomal alpha-mannosidase
MTSDKLAQAMGVAQHHDAVSGTEKQHVADDYAMRLHIGQVQCQSIVGAALNKLSYQDKPLNWEFCEYLNISVCPPSVNDSFDVTVYNPLARTTNSYITLPLNTNNVTLTDCKGNPQTYDIIPVTQQTMAVQGNRSGHGVYNMLFSTGSSVPPLGYCTYSVRPKAAQKEKLLLHTPKHTAAGSISNEYLQVTFDDATGHVNGITNKNRSITLSVNQQFFWYNSSFGNDASHQTSNAYVFRPNSSTVYPVNDNNNKAQVTVVQGALYQEVQQVFSDYASQVVRLYKGANFVEFEYTIGPIPFSDGLGKEIISRFDTDLASSGMWYTDANGREMQERIRNHRNTWTLNNTEPVAGNYYPVNSRISIQDKTKRVQFTVLTDRSQGGSSLKDGSVELMVHRRLQHDDGRGVGEPLNETGQFGTGLIIRGRHWVVLDTVEESAAIHRILGEQLLLRPTLTFARVPNTAPPSSVSHSALATALPPNVHLLTFQYLNKTTLLLRLEHQFETGEDAELSKPVTLDLNAVFANFKIGAITELVLGANERLENVKRFSWNTSQQHSPTGKTAEPLKASNITLNPMEIRTFELTLQ